MYPHGNIICEFTFLSGELVTYIACNRQILIKLKHHYKIIASFVPFMDATMQINILQRLETWQARRNAYWKVTRKPVSAPETHWLKRTRQNVVTVTWHKHNRVQNHRQFDRLFSNIFVLTRKNHQSSTLLPFVRWIRMWPKDSSQMASNIQRLSMTWYRVFFHCVSNVYIAWYSIDFIYYQHTLKRNLFIRPWPSNTIMPYRLESCITNLAIINPCPNCHTAEIAIQIVHSKVQTIKPKICS